MALTERQKEIKALQQQGLKADQIATQLGISTNAVYQQLRRMKTRTGGTAKPAAAKAPAKPAPKAKPAAAAPKATAAPAPAKPITPERALKLERDSIAAELKDSRAEVDAAQKALDAAQGRYTAALDGKRERVTQIDRALEFLTGEVVDPLPGFEPEPEPTTMTEAVKADAERIDQIDAGKPAAEQAKPPAPGVKPAAAKAPAKPDAKAPAPKPAAATPKPATQAEREATADPFDDAPAQAAARRQSGEPETVAAA